jgi:DNA polymerase-2
MNSSKLDILGWLFDSYPMPDGIVVWLVDRNGVKYKTMYPFHPVFYMSLNAGEEKMLAQSERKLPIVVNPKKVKKRELYSGNDVLVTEIEVRNPLLYQKAVRVLSEQFKFYQFFNADIKPTQMFYYTTQLFPLAYGSYIIENGFLKSWTLHDAFDAEKYEVPDLTKMTLTPSMTLLAPKYQQSLELQIEVEGRTIVLEQDSPEELIAGIDGYIQKYDPDIILTSYGDATLMPLLVTLSQKHKVPLHLNRDDQAGYLITKATSFFSYGSIKHREGVFELAGRWHLDKENSFIMGEGDLEGLFELSRLSQVGIQHQARTSIGSALSSMQLSWAYRNNILVPYKRPLKEAFKSFSTLLMSDRGGLHFMPKIGYHEQVAELDFASMYPSLMMIHNISPETLNCLCCPDSKHFVPEIDYRICEKRIGLVPTTLRPILKKRAMYKLLKKNAATDELKEKYDRIQSALKWILVTCFGYLGFKKSRMGRIEAHEAVNALSRDGLLTAKAIAEENGFKLIHAIVDCVWLKKDGATAEDYEELALKIEHKVGVKISLEGIYRWILFPASKMDEAIPTATRYVGTYDTGETKIRGIEVRRRDTPKYVKRLQEEMLDLMSKAESIEGVKSMLPELLDIVKEKIVELQSGKVDPLQLIIKRHISKDPFEYSNRSINAIVSQTLSEAGVHLSPGEGIEYIITDATGKRDPMKAKPLALYALHDGYDADKYSEFVLQAAETLLEPFGYSLEVLKQETGLSKERKKKTKPFIPTTMEFEFM